MAYPNSSDVAAGQPTASAHYNNLRKDAVYLGNVSADSVNLGTFLQAFVLNLELEYLATNRLRVPYVSTAPATIMINGCMLVQTANIDLAASSFSGGAATWYVFANRTAGLTTFTLTVNTSPVPGADQRLIGECYWNGTNLVQSSIYSYTTSGGMRLPDYDSGWFAVVYNFTYAKAHGLGRFPRECILYFSTSADFSSSSGLVIGLGASHTAQVLYWDETNVTAKTNSTSTGGAQYSTQTIAGSGYYRILAWL